MKVLSIEPTPNPNAKKFFVNQPLARGGVRQFDNVEAGKSDPLAKEIFSLPGVKSVFYTGQFVTVGKSDAPPWADLEAKVSSILEKFDPSKLHPGAPSSDGGPLGDELLDRINQVLDENVRPALEGDGGGLEILGLNGYMLTIHYQGACGGCPSASQGTMMAIENLLKAMVDPRIQVISD